MDLVQWLGVQLDDDEKAVRDRLCVNCGNGVEPLSSPVGTTGYTHEGLRLNDQGELERSWEGRRCSGRLVGAEPVQNPDRVLREIASKRGVLRAYEERCAEKKAGAMIGDLIDEYEAVILPALAAVYSDRPGYRAEWAPTE